MFIFFSSRRRHTRCSRDWSSDVCSSDLHRGSWIDGPLADAPILSDLIMVRVRDVSIPPPDAADAVVDLRRRGARARWAPVDARPNPSRYKPPSFGGMIPPRTP